MDTKQKIKIFSGGIVATLSLLLLYFIFVGALSGLNFALSQFSAYWYFLISLALGFGIQIILYSYLKELVKNKGQAVSGKPMAVTGTTSTLAMISCCAHYLANIIPIIGITGALTIVAQYQVEIFWVGLLFNLLGIAFIAKRIIKFNKG